MNKVINGTSGLLLRVTVEAPSLVLGTKLQGTLHNIKLGQTNETSINLADVDFEIEIVEDVTVLDENSTTAPEAATGVNVRVKRTINANEMEHHLPAICHDRGSGESSLWRGCSTGRLQRLRV